MKLVLRGLCFSLLVLVGACGNDPSLTVTIVSDLVAGEDVTKATVEVASSPFETLQDSQSTVLGPGDNLLGGVIAAEWPKLPSDNYFLSVRLEAAGTLALERTLLLSLEESRALLVAMTSSCQSKTCPEPGESSDLGECVGGVCVNRSCSSAFLRACPTRCQLDSECPNPGPCGSVRCVEGTCVSRSDACVIGERCDNSRGCVETAAPDAGP